jgi:hypothetical protein
MNVSMALQLQRGFDLLRRARRLGRHRSATLLFINILRAQAFLTRPTALCDRK